MAEENNLPGKDVVIAAKMNRKENILGWIGVASTLIIAGFWAYWGANENFHEGWYSTSIADNLILFITQYLLFTFSFILLAFIALKWKWPGLLLHFAAGVFCMFFFSGAIFSAVGLLIVVPLAILGLIYFYGDPKPKKLAYCLVLAVPMAIILAISIPQGIKVSQRTNDSDFGMRIVEGNGVTLAWAPEGPGWPDRGISWEEANNICRYLSEDGTRIMDTEQNIWRLPTVEEAVRSMTLHNENAGGVLFTDKMKAKYRIVPDKETPIWKPNSKVIYYWTSETTRNNTERAYIIVYHGDVFDKRKTDHPDYLSFRAVKKHRIVSSGQFEAAD
jgi:hypothetical protein